MQICNRQFLSSLLPKCSSLSTYVLRYSAKHFSPKTFGSYKTSYYLCHVKKSLAVQMPPVHAGCFLYPQTSESNITAPCRVCGNAPGSPANETLTTRSAVSLCQKSLVMATTINATRAAQRAFSLKEWTDAKRKSLNLWLSTPSNFYTQLCEFPVTRLLAIRVNLLSLCIIVGATAIEQQPVVSIVSALCAAWLVYRINQSDKKGGTL